MVLLSDNPGYPLSALLRYLPLCVPIRYGLKVAFGLTTNYSVVGVLYFLANLLIKINLSYHKTPSILKFGNSNVTRRRITTQYVIS